MTMKSLGWWDLPWLALLLLGLVIIAQGALMMHNALHDWGGLGGLAVAVIGVVTIVIAMHHFLYRR